MTRQIPLECLTALALVPVRYLGGRVNQHWLVEQHWRQYVLRAYHSELIDRIQYELLILRRMAELGWPVAQAIEDPIEVDGHWWCLFAHLPGAPLATSSLAEQRARGRLLAEFHQASAALDVGQNPGSRRTDQILRDPALRAAIMRFECRDPDIGHILRWHLDCALKQLDALDLSSATSLLVHGDFAPWNLLFEGGRLSGLLDFEFARWDLRVADFALSWRGYQDEVIAGYEEVWPLNELERAMIVPAFWACLFSGLAVKIGHSLDNEGPIDLSWETGKLLLRSQIHNLPLYPGR